MKRLLFLSIAAVAIAASFSFKTNNCGNLFFFKNGTSATMTYFDADGKTTGSSKTVFSDYKSTDSGVSVTASMENFDKKGKSNMKSNYTVSCINGTLYFDMKMLLPSEQAQGYKDMEMTVIGADKAFPLDLTVGQKLADNEVTFTFKTKEGVEMPMGKMTVKITNRKVEAIENITTSAGTWECYKISEDFAFKTLFTIKGNTKSWLSKKVGIVKTESFKENGKLTGKTELTALIQ